MNLSIGGLTKKAFLNAVSAFIDFGARVGVSLIVTPILVSGLGSMLFGVWQVLGRLVSYMSAADGQPTQALKWVIANQQGSDDFYLKRHAIGSAIGVWLLLLPILVVAGTILVWLSPIITKIQGEMIKPVRITCLLLVINLILGGLITIPAAVLRGMNLGYKRMGVAAGMNVLGGGLTAGAIYFGWGLIGVGFAHLIQSLTTGILFWYLVKIYIPWFGVVRASFKEIRKFFGLSIWYAAWNLVDKLLLFSDVLVLTIVMSANAVTDYILTGYVSQTLIAVVTIMVGSAAPGLGGLIGQKKYSKVIELRNEMIVFSILFATVLGAMILLWNRSFLTLWVGNEHYAGTWVNLMLVLIAVQLLLLRNEAYLIDLTLNLRRKVFLGLSAAFTSIVLCAFLTNIFGILGLSAGIFLGRLILMIGYPMITGKFLGFGQFSQFRTFIRPLLAMSILFALAVPIGKIIVIENWMELFLYATGTLVILIALSFRTVLSSSYRKQALKRLTKSIPLNFIS